MNGINPTWHSPDPTFEHPFWTAPDQMPSRSATRRRPTGIPADATTRVVTPGAPPVPTRATPSVRPHPSLMFVIGFVAIILAWGSFAPGEMHKRVPVSAVMGNPCGPIADVRSAVENDDAGPYPLAQLTCSDGVTLAGTLR